MSASSYTVYFSIDFLLFWPIRAFTVLKTSVTIDYEIAQIGFAVKNVSMAEI